MDLHLIIPLDLQSRSKQKNPMIAVPTLGFFDPARCGITGFPILTTYLLCRHFQQHPI